MTKELNDIFKVLIQQCNIESISTKDLAAELNSLYAKVDALEKQAESKFKDAQDSVRALAVVTASLESYKATHVLPVKEIEKRSAELEKNEYKFSIEKEYIARENKILTETLRMVTSQIAVHESFYGPNSGNYTRNPQNYQADLPRTIAGSDLNKK